VVLVQIPISHWLRPGESAIMLKYRELTRDGGSVHLTYFVVDAAANVRLGGEEGRHFGPPFLLRWEGRAEN
jgi:hypothetical protein